MSKCLCHQPVFWHLHLYSEKCPLSITEGNKDDIWTFAERTQLILAFANKCQNFLTFSSETVQKAECSEKKSYC